MTADLRYLSEEIVEEGSLYICAGYLQREHGWSMDKFRDVNHELSGDMICGYYRYSGNNDFIDVKLEDIDFGDPESLKEINFSPGERAWDFYGKHHPG